MEIMKLILMLFMLIYLNLNFENNYILKTIIYELYLFIF